MAVANSHLGMDVENLEDALQFFESIFQLKPYIFDKIRRNFTVQFGNMDISVFETSVLDFNKLNHGPSFHIGLKVDSIDKLNDIYVKSLSNLLCVENTGIFDRTDGDKAFFFRGLSNFRFEVFYGEHKLASGRIL